MCVEEMAESSLVGVVGHKQRLLTGGGLQIALKLAQTSSAIGFGQLQELSLTSFYIFRFALPSSDSRGLQGPTKAECEGPWFLAWILVDGV